MLPSARCPVNARHGPAHTAPPWRSPAPQRCLAAVVWLAHPHGGLALFTRAMQPAARPLLMSERRKCQYIAQIRYHVLTSRQPTSGLYLTTRPEVYLSPGARGRRAHRPRGRSSRNFTPRARVIDPHIASAERSCRQTISRAGSVHRVQCPGAQVYRQWRQP